jgi:dual specificity tyrosine-phosphorylation-regulated kinase 2/3/4
MEGVNDEVLFDFIERCLVYDPQERLKPNEALNHPFLDDAPRIISLS